MYNNDASLGKACGKHGGKVEFGGAFRRELWRPTKYAFKARVFFFFNNIESLFINEADRSSVRRASAR